MHFGALKIIIEDWKNESQNCLICFKLNDVSKIYGCHKYEELNIIANFWHSYPFHVLGYKILKI